MEKEIVFEVKKYKYPQCPIDLAGKKYRMDDMPVEPYSWHYHKEIEFLCIVKGKLTVSVESNTYEMYEGDWMVIEPGLAHYTVKTENVEYGCAIFPVLPHIVDTFPEGSGVFLTNKNLTDKFVQLIDSFPEIKQKGKELFCEMLEAQREKRKGYMLVLRANIQRLLYYTIQVLNATDIPEEQKKYNYSKIVPAIKYIDEHMSEKIDVNHLAELCHYNYFYFSKIFRYFMGTTITEYINRERYKYAKMYLIESNMSISDIAHKVGFSNENSLYAYFKKVSGITPAQFRRNIKK